jgi:FixJ family two-component response regulator
MIITASEYGSQMTSRLDSKISPTVFVVDDDISVRQALEVLIRDEGMEVETFRSAQEFLARPHAAVPSCLVLDVSLPGLNGLELQKRISVEQQDMPIIFITGYGDIPMTVQAMKAGAVEFLTKPFADHALLNAVRSAIDRSTVRLARREEIQALNARCARLTPREREVMGLVVVGLLNKQVADKLHISEITEKAHRGCMMRKMEANSFAELVHMASRLRLKHPPAVSVSVAT